MTQKVRNRRILITGVSGFVGRGIVRALANSHPSWTILGLDRVPPPESIATCLARFFLVDITESTQVAAVFTHDNVPDLVIHTAALIPARAARYSVKEPDWQRTKAVNYDGTVNIVAAALAAGCVRLIYTSSVTTVMDDIDHDYFNVAETNVYPDLVQLHYGRSKVITERYLRSMEHVGLKACILRPCTIFGPEDTAVMSVIHDLISKGETCFVVGDGCNLSDWLYIDNAVHAHVLAAENMLATATASGHTIYITNHESVYFWDFLTFIWAQYGHYAPWRIYIPAYLAFVVAYVLELVTWVTGRPATLTSGSVKDGVRTFFVNNDKSIELLGYRPQVPLAEGVIRACEGYKRHLEASRAG